MQLGTSDTIAAVSAVLAFVAIVFAAVAWLFPRSPKVRKIPEFLGEIQEGKTSKFMSFLEENDDTIVKIRAFVDMNEEDIINESTDDDGNNFHTLTLRNPLYEGLPNGGIEVGINPEKGSKTSPMVFANGAYHLKGFFVIEHHPGMWQGFRAITLTEVSAEQMALRS